MPFDFNNYLNVAVDLATKADDGSKRSAISRAYYSVYHLALSRAESKIGPRPIGKSHKWCWDQYILTPDRECRRLGTEGDRMKRLRVDADYKPADIKRLDEVVNAFWRELDSFGPTSQPSIRSIPGPKPRLSPQER